MATPPSASPTTAHPEPTIYEAELASGATGGVLSGKEITFDEAVTRRKAGSDVVVCGGEKEANRALAQQIEAAIGPYLRQAQHTRSAGPRALPHFQQRDSMRPGHTFYETAQRRAMRTKP